MVNMQILEGKWNEITGKLRDRWGELTDDELSSARGNADQLIGLIQRKTGESREAIEQYVDQLTSAGGELGGRMAEQGRHYAEQAGHFAQRAREQFREAGPAARKAYAQAESVVQRNPAQSVGAVFLMGLAAGFVVGLIFKMRD